MFTCARFEELFQDLFRLTLDPVAKVLRDSKIDKDVVDVHKIVLISGSASIPRIVKLGFDFFRLDEAGAYAAAIQAAILSGDTSEKT